VALIEAVLTYRAHGIASEHAVPIGATDDRKVLRALRDRLIADAENEAQTWRTIDPGVFALKAAEAERLGRVLAFLLPDEELRPELRLVKPGETEVDG